MNPDWSILEEEMQQVEYLQQTVIDCVQESNLNEDPDPQLILDYYHHLYALMSKQGVFYTRLLLMKDPKLAGLVDAVEMVCDSLGKPETMSYQEYHSTMCEESKLAICEMCGIDPDSDFEVDFRWMN